MAQTPKNRISPDDGDPLAQLIRGAGRRAPIAPGRQARVRDAVKASWKRVVLKRRIIRGLIGVASASVAALVLFTIGSHYLNEYRAPVEIAKVEFIDGAVHQINSKGSQALKVGDAIFSGSAVETTGRSHTAITLSDGASLRLDAETRIRFGKSGSAIHLESGAVYVDSAVASSSPNHAQLSIETAYGVAHDVGTQFETRILNSDARPLCIRVREGRVDLKRELGSVTAVAGTELTAAASGSPVQRPILPNDPMWNWVADAAPPFQMDGNTVDAFVKWVCREQGWQAVYDDNRTAQAAKSTRFHGAVRGMTPRKALDAVLPAAAMTYTLEGPTLRLKF